MTKEEIIDALTAKGYEASEQAVRFLDQMGRDSDVELVEDFIEWYEAHYSKNIGGQDVNNYFMQKKAWTNKKEKLKAKDKDTFGG